jgi:hypothetical protein
MRIPKYWRRREGNVQHPDGRELHLFAWGWSESNVADAEARAEERFESLQQRVRQGLDLPKGYGYGSRPVREQILQEITGSQGEPEAVLTRNAYGSVVLNAARAMFIDVDAPPESGGGLLGKLFGRGSSKGTDAALDQVRTALISANIGPVRLYRTAGGLRLLVTGRPYTPASSDAERLMRVVGADPAFIQLCKVQDSFRARLTPKPWRVGRPAPPGRFPREDGVQQTAFDDWLRKYERACESKATCRFIETFGGDYVDPPLAPLLRLHDEETKATTDLPLA